MKKLAAALALALFAVMVPSTAGASGSYFYAAHVQNVGWQDPVWDGADAGTTGKSLRLEAISFVYIGQVARGHVQNIGWQEWRGGDATVGTTGKSLRLEAIQVKSTVPGQKIHCQAHVQNIGWMAPVGDGETCGTTGRSLRLEAVRIWLVPTAPVEPPAPAEPVLSTVATVGDVGLEAAGLNTLSAMGAANPTLTFLLGDLSYGTAAQPFCDAVSARIPGPFGWVQGNHELPPDSDGPVTGDFNACLPVTPNASGDRAVEEVIQIPGATIITASPQLGVSYAAGSAGHARIAAAIDAAKAAGKWPILAMHEPHYSVGQHGASGPDSKALADLAVQRGVPLVLTAHDHNYSRAVVGGTTFIVAGMGGHKVRGLDRSSRWWPQTVVAYPGTPGYLSLTIREHSITGQTVGGGADTFEITRG